MYKILGKKHYYVQDNLQQKHVICKHNQQKHVRVQFDVLYTNNGMIPDEKTKVGFEFLGNAS